MRVNNTPWLIRGKPLRDYGMEELAARQRMIQPSGGVLFARHSDNEEKVKARNLALDIFCGTAWPQHLHLITLPGLHWRFERQLLHFREPNWREKKKPHRTALVGVENDRAIYFASTAQMPGLKTPHSRLKPFPYPFAEQCIKTRFASFFFANVDDFMQADCWGGQGWSAAWLDFTGPLNAERLAIIEAFYHRRIRGVIIITAFKARWDSKTSKAIAAAGGYCEWLQKHLPGRILHYIEYFDTSPMAQIAVAHPTFPLGDTDD